MVSLAGQAYVVSSAAREEALKEEVVPTTF